MPEMNESHDEHANGRVVRVIGPVVDVEFPPNQLPEINTALTVDITIDQLTTTITCEVAQHIHFSEIHEFNGGKGVDVIIEMLANENLERDFEALAHVRADRDRRQPRLDPIHPAAGDDKGDHYPWNVAV